MKLSSEVLYLKYTKIEDYKGLNDAMKFQMAFGEDASWGRKLISYVWSTAFNSVQGQKAAKYLQSVKDWLRFTSVSR